MISPSMMDVDFGVGRIAGRDPAIPSGISGEDFEVFSLGCPGQIRELGGEAGLVCDRLADALHCRGIAEAHCVGGQRAHLLQDLDLGGGEGHVTGARVGVVRVLALAMETYSLVEVRLPAGAPTPPGAAIGGQAADQVLDLRPSLTVSGWPRRS